MNCGLTLGISALQIPFYTTFMLHFCACVCCPLTRFPVRKSFCCVCVADSGELCAGHTGFTNTLLHYIYASLIFVHVSTVHRHASRLKKKKENKVCCVCVTDSGGLCAGHTGCGADDSLQVQPAVSVGTQANRSSQPMVSKSSNKEDCRRSETRSKQPKGLKTTLIFYQSISQCFILCLFTAR